MNLREADSEDLAGVMNVIDGGNLELAAETVEERIDAENVLVIEEDGPVLGAVVLEPLPNGAFVEGVAVRRRRRGHGLGTTLVQTAADRHGSLIADFDEDLRLFYQSLGFEIEPLGAGRFRGKLDP